MRRRFKIEVDNDHNRWMISYADFITLLFGFFVMMYAVSAVNEGEYKEIAESITSAFAKHQKSDEELNTEKTETLVDDDTELSNEEEIESNTITTDDIAAIEDKENNSDPIKKDDVVIKRMADSVREAMSSWIAEGIVNVYQFPVRLEIDINANALFKSGSSVLSNDAQPILEQLGAVLTSFPNAIHVEGFTDNVPIRTPNFPSNWELSAARAAAVVRMFSESGIEPKRMAAVGYGEHRPFSDNDSQLGRARNRRVVLAVLAGEDPRYFINVDNTKKFTDDELNSELEIEPL